MKWFFSRQFNVSDVLIAGIFSAAFMEGYYVTAVFGCLVAGAISTACERKWGKA